MSRKDAALARRRARAVDAFGNVADTIGPIEHGMSLFALTRGQFSMVDIARYLVHSVGGAAVALWTWTIASYELETMGGLLADGAVTGGRLIVDYSAVGRNGPLLAEWQAKFGEGSVRVARTHAKICRVWGDGWKFLARGSCNLNFNPRNEQIDVTEGGPDYDLVQSIEDAMPVVGLNPSFAEAANASGLGGAFERSTLDAFAGLPTWRP